MGIPPTGRSFRAAGIVIDRIVDGQIAEEWETRDSLGAMQQLGIIPSPDQ
jgi:predicted ester cyclase